VTWRLQNKKPASALIAQGGQQCHEHIAHDIGKLTLRWF